MKEPSPDGGPAFPVHAIRQEWDETWGSPCGMSLRDYFAAKAMVAMSGFADRKAIHDRFPDCGPEEIELAIAQAAYLQADAMMKAREAKL